MDKEKILEMLGSGSFAEVGGAVKALGFSVISISYTGNSPKKFTLKKEGFVGEALLGKDLEDFAEQLAKLWAEAEVNTGNGNESDDAEEEAKEAKEPGEQKGEKKPKRRRKKEEKKDEPVE